MSKLRLGPIIEEKPVRLTIELPGALFRQLASYAEAHAQATGLGKPLPAERLIPPIVEKFIASDRGFTRTRRASEA